MEDDARRAPRWTGDRTAFAAALAGWIETAGDARYDEDVTQAEHACQCAALAVAEGLPDALVAAALLHDVGHLLAAADASRVRDLRHEEIGARWLARAFGPDVTEPVRLHVAAKRWLCGTDTSYSASLSPASVRSLVLQGGPMDADEARGFATHAHAEAAVRLRRLDEEAKVAGLDVPRAAAYRTLLASCMRTGPGRD